MSWVRWNQIFFFFYVVFLFSNACASLPSSSSSSSLWIDEANMTALQKHVSFFDRNKDGVIYLSETYDGLRAIGLGVAFSSASAAGIHAMLGPKTKLTNSNSQGKLSSPLLPIYIQNIQRGKHGSDTGVYDSEGRYVPAKFEEIFQKHAHTTPTALTSDEVDQMLKANLVPGDVSGGFAAQAEWKLLYSLAKDKDGLLQKDTIRAVYDGSLFVQLEKERSSSKKKKA